MVAQNDGDALDLLLRKEEVKLKYLWEPSCREKLKLHLVNLFIIDVVFKVISQGLPGLSKLVADKKYSFLGILVRLFMLKFFLLLLNFLLSLFQHISMQERGRFHKFVLHFLTYLIRRWVLTLLGIHMVQSSCMRSSWHTLYLRSISAELDWLSGW